MKVKNIIFDFGGVIYDISFNAATEAFAELGVKNFKELYSYLKQDHLFEDLEVGRITPEEFHRQFRRQSGLEVSDEAIDTAWNRLLTGFREERIRMLEKARNHYRIFLLSNSNQIHYQKYRQEFEEQFGYQRFNQIFERTWFSHEIGLKKPDNQIFEYILKDGDLNPFETMFIDDMEENALGATYSGISGYFLNLEQGEDMVDLFDDNGQLRFYR